MKKKITLLTLLLTMNSGLVFADFPDPYSQPETFDGDVVDVPPQDLAPPAPIDDYLLPMLVLGIAFGAMTFAKKQKKQCA
jgi:hypothetical protein